MTDSFVFSPHPLQTAAAQLGPHGADSIVVKNPMPGGMGALMRTVFNLPQWLQIAAVVIGGSAACIMAYWAWTHRVMLLEWLRSRNRPWKIALAAIAFVVIGGSAGAGLYGYEFMEHNNDFCQGCHVMKGSWSKFQKSEHAKLECHDCHRQSQYANARQLFLWIAERPSEIGKHAPVPTKVCAECHITNKPDSLWQRISATAGHRLHMASDSSALKKIECVTCHGQEVHRFAAVDKTCGQSGCHEAGKTKINLGKMAGQTTLHCTGCHEFNVPVKETVSTDSTKTLLVPTANKCLGCHEMSLKMKGYDPALDKHKGLCGSCHDAHKDKKPSDALTTCANAGCHKNADNASPFHRGIPAKALEKCESCHQAHTWKTDGNSCQSCHSDIFTNEGRGSAHPPAKVDAKTATETPRTSAHRRVGVAAPAATEGVFRLASFTPSLHPSQSVAPTQLAKPAATRGRRVSLPAGARPFKHGTHRQLQCTACHNSGNKHGALTVTTAADCASCHHAKDRAIGCEGCHAKGQLAKVALVTNTIKMSVWKAPKERSASFRHPQHRDLECKACHTNGPELKASTDCSTCHVEHHDAQRDCRACHAGVKDVHKRTVHQGCAASGCHTDKATAALPPARQVCMGCHVEMVNHKRGGDCADCHKVTWTTTAPATVTAPKL